MSFGFVQAEHGTYSKNLRMVANKNVVLVTDTPTPYRNHLFERMAAILPQFGFDLQVWFLALASHYRPWRFELSDLNYPARVFTDIGPRLRGLQWHVNPWLLVELRAFAPDVLIVGGWWSPSHALAPCVVPKGTRTILWAESNVHSVTRRDHLTNRFRANLIKQYDGFLVPQASSRDLIEHFLPSAAARPFMRLPNVIDAQRFRDTVERLRLSRHDLRRHFGVDQEQLWVCPARLAPEKGLVEFLHALREGDRVKLVVAGEGPLRSTIRDIVQERRLPVSLVGQMDEPEMLRLYAASDVFLLPSAADPSPLSPVEACAAALPLMVSDRIGNRDDVVVPSDSGWVLRFGDEIDNRRIVELVLATPASALEQMGRASLRIYNARFDTDACVRRFAEDVTSFAAGGVGARNMKR